MNEMIHHNTVSSFLVQQLYELGVRHVFGVPGDYILGFYKYLNESKKLTIVNTCDEQGAGFAADAYARINGLGVVCVTYCVGGLKVVNATAQAFAEESPLIIISGSPGIAERIKNPLLHHKVRDFDTQLEIFKHITVDSAVISDPLRATQDIQRVLLSALRYKRPVYIELPRDKVHASIPFGAPLTDIDFSITPPIDQSKVIYSTSERLSIKHHNFENVYLKDFLNGLIEMTDYSRNTWNAVDVGFIKQIKHEQHSNRVLTNQRLANLEKAADRRKKVTVGYLFERLNSSVNSSTVVIADTGDSLFGSLDLTIHNQTEFLCPAYYLSMGFAVPAAIGAQLANPKLRPLVVVGDGAFQMTGMEVSTVAKFGLSPIIVILNNEGYGTERPIIDGPFNDLLSWDYSRILEVIGYGKGFVIESEEDLDRAILESGQIYNHELCMLDVKLDKYDGSAALQRITEVLHRRAY